MGEIEDEAAEDMQLAENIQRENLSLNDTAAAVRKLFERLGSQQAVAERVKKSKSWVSKHLSVTCGNFAWCARSLLNDGVCEDLETLNIVNQIWDMDTTLAYELVNKIRDGNAGRATAREYLARAKQTAEEWDAGAAQREAEQKAERERQAKARAEFSEHLERERNERYALHKEKLRGLFNSYSTSESVLIPTLRRLMENFDEFDQFAEEMEYLMEAIQLDSAGALFEESK